MRKNTAIVSGIYPETHYTRSLFSEIAAYTENVVLLTENETEAREFANSFQHGRVITLWKKNLSIVLSVPEYCRKNGVTCVHVQHEFNMYHRNYYLGVLSFLILLLQLRRKVPCVIVTIHAIVSRKQNQPEFLQSLGISANPVTSQIVCAAFSLFYKSIRALSNIVVVHSDNAQNILVTDYGFAPERCRVIPIGIGLPETLRSVDYSQPHSGLADKRIVLCFGYLIRRKGLEMLIDAFAQISREFPDLVLVIAGGPLREDREYLEELCELVRKKSLENVVKFTGFVAQYELLSLVQAAEIIVVPHKISVSSSGVLAIALGAGKPVIAAKHPAIDEVILSGDNGLTYNPESSADLAKQITILLEDSDLRTKLSKGATETANKLSWKVTAERHCSDLYDLGRGD